MAEQLNHTNSEVVYLDFSRESMAIAQHRSTFRGWLNIIWIEGWIESIPRLGLGNFDLAVSTGVLHHLKNPQTGLSTINEAQLSYGGAEIMVYGMYGRTPIYWIQKAMQMINEKEKLIKDEIENAKHVLEKLPKDHLFHTIGIDDHKAMGDSGISDLLLHKRDISFTTTTVYQWLENSGYNVIDFTHPENTIPISLQNKIEERWLLEKIFKSHRPKVHEIGEIIYGKITKQDLYVSKKLNSEANFDEFENTVMYAYGSPMGFRPAINEKSNYLTIRNETLISTMILRGWFHEESNRTFDAINKDSSVVAILDGRLVWPSTKFNNFMLEYLIKKPIRPMSLASMISKFKIDTNSTLTMEEGRKSLIRFYSFIKQSRMFFMKHKSIPTFPLTCCTRNLYSIRNSNTYLVYK